MILIMLFFSDEVIPYNTILVDSYKIFNSENNDECILQYSIRNEIFHTKQWDYYHIVDMTNDIDQQSKVVEILQQLKEK
jgi:hypothetical protein